MSWKTAISQGLLIVGILLVLASGAYLAFIKVSRFLEHASSMPVRNHQRSVTRTLADWEKEYGQVRNVREAERAIDMLEYVQGYYVPTAGYHSDAQTEALLEAQRTKTLRAIAGALERFSGQDFGVDVTRWREWQQRHGTEPE